MIDDGRIAGRVTSVGHSPTFDRPIGMAFVAPHQAEPGATFQIKAQKGRMVEAEVVKMPFYDPDNERQQM